VNAGTGRELSQVFGSGLVLALCLLTAPVQAADDPATAGSSTPRFEIDSDPLFDEEFEKEPDGFPDPFENTNRPIFGFNGTVDKWILDPLTKAYGWVFPGPVKKSIRNFFLNLGEPATLFNNVLQLEWKDAGTATTRFALNTTIGIAGLFDPAARMGIPYHNSDFGQTLALAGTPSGPNLVVPVFGPNNTRDGFGVLADTTMHPLTWFLGPANFLIYGIYTSGHGISTREHHVQQLDALRVGSIDFYASMRNAYYQNRIADLWSRREYRRNDWTPLPPLSSPPSLSSPP
jgi:phospholipid-binding lipoprotein MlaA